MGALASLVTAPLRWALLLVSRLVPRRRRLWAFGSSFGRRFADNPKWLYLHCFQHRERLGVRAVWVTRDASLRRELAAQGLDARHWAWWNLRGLWVTMRAGVWVYDSDLWDLGYATSAGAKKVNLWHGIPLKRVKLAIPDHPKHPDRVARHAAWPRRLLEKTLRPGAGAGADLVPATSEECQARFAQTFGVPLDRIPILGFARNDVLLAEEVPPAATRHSIHDEVDDHQADGGRVVLYMPTFRDTRARGEGHSVRWDLLDEAAKAHDLLVAVKLHPRDQAAPEDALRYERLRFLPPKLDAYPMLRSADALITDYSSVYYDYLLLDRPIFFFPYDLESYVEKDRPLHEDYDEATPGPKAPTTEELVAHLASWLEDPEGHERDWGGRRRLERDRLHAHVDAGSAERVAQEILARFA